MFFKIKNRIERELDAYIRKAKRLSSLKNISPVLFNHIKEFISRKGKRIRPILFVVGYLGYAKKTAGGLYKSALSLELLHDFVLVHDDIIDKSNTRRGKPSMHAMLNRFLRGRGNLKFNGEDLTIVIGDVMFAMALDAFLSVKEDCRRKEAALKKLIEAAMYTGSGEFIELLYGIKKITKITKADIYKVYDYKTANYSFASPLVFGAALAGARDKELKKLFNYGIYLGRAFQIKDDIIGIFSTEKEIGKSNLTDIHESKKTLLVWYSYRYSGRKDRAVIEKVFGKTTVSRKDLLTMRRIISDSGALDYAKKEIYTLINKSRIINKSLGMKLQYRNSLADYAKTLLTP